MVGKLREHAVGVVTLVIGFAVAIGLAKVVRAHFLAAMRDPTGEWLILGAAVIGLVAIVGRNMRKNRKAHSQAVAPPRQDRPL